ncbi:MAG: ParB/RepB/Spo0J family partition protein [Lachnospiraceae bacterium]|nr:ParB/RepB/Spo0J family partition protein [Lachnospiraceae bacterium]
MARRSGLGKGLDSLISSEYTKKTVKTDQSAEKSPKLSTKIDENVEKSVDKKDISLQNAVMLKIAEIEPNREQPRKNFDEEALDDLADSIRQYGILQPLLVKPVGQHYEIIAGERRWRAAKLAGLKEIPVIVRDESKEKIMEISLIENIQREDLNAIEEAQAYQRLLTEFGYRQEDLAAKISRSRTAITNRLRLLKLTEKVQSMVQENMITEGHARALIPIEDPDLQFQTAMTVMDNSLSVRETEKLVKKVLNPVSSADKDAWKQADQVVYDKLEEDLRNIMGTKVAIQRKDRNKGRIVIDYYSSEELERLMDWFAKH